nr:abnormal spindle-like microcephaly-associated protein [Nerophis lumbriciformis]
MSGVLSTASGQRGFMEFSPTRNGDKTDKENVAVLSLVLFSKAPFVSFGTVKTGTSKSTILRIENPTSETEAVVTVVRIPSSKGFSVDTNTFTIQPQDSFSLTISWTPTEEGGIRELIIFSANGVLKHQAVLLGKAEASKKKKKSLWDAIKNKKRGEKGSPYRAKKIVPPTKMAASKTVVVSRKPPYEQEKLQGPLSPLNDVKTGRNKSISEHTLLDDEPLKSEQQRCLKPIQNQSCLVDQENVHPGQRRSSLLLATNETVMRGSSRSLPGTVDNKNLTKMLNKTLSPIGTPERLKKLMPQIQPVEHTACVSLNTVHSGPVISLHDALTLINSDLALVNSSSKSSSPSCEFSDSLEFKSEDHDHFKACPDSPELSDSTESRLTFFVRKNVDVPKVEKPLDKPKKMSFNCETVIKNKALVTSCGSGQKIKKSRRRLLEKTLELLEDSSQSEHGPGTPNLPVIELDIKTEGSERVGSLCDDFKDGPTLRLDDAQMFINTHVSSPPSSAHWSVSTSSPSNSPPMTFTSSSPLHLGQSSPLHCSNTSNPLLTVPAQKTDIPPQLIPANQSTQEELFPVHMVTDSRKRKHEECLRGVMTIGHGEKNNPVKMTKMVSWKSEHIESAEEKTTSQRQPVKVNGRVRSSKTSAKTRRSSVSAQKKPSSSKLPLRGAASVKSSKAQSVKCVKMSAVAMRKLTFVKPTQTAIPRHPLPFAAKNMFYDERWIEKQERGFTWWLNYILTPDDFKVNTEMTKVNAAPLTMVCSNNISVSKAPTKEEMSFSTYTARRKLNRLRRAACQIFTSETMVKAIKRLELEVEAKRLRIRKDRHLWKDIGERQKVLNWLLSYNPLWLRIGLETIFGELISLESNSDSTGLAMFILQRLLWNPDIAAEFRHPKVPHLYKDGHEEALSSFTLKKLLLLVCFLDKAKESRLIEHNPCLFCVDGEFKTSKDLLLAFSRDFLSGEGILPRHLGYLGLSVSHVQTPLDEFDFSVMNLAVDLKCGIRLVRVMELLIKQWDLSAKLRLPAISRLQKIHNMDIALQVLKIRGVDLKDEYGSIIDSRDIVDGHREKTLSLLWKIIFSFQVEVVLDEDQLREEIIFLKRTLRTKQKLASLRAGLGLDTSGLKTKVPFEHSSTKVVLLMEWARAVCDFYNLTLENFTVTFSDGRVLCYLIHHYHPGLITAESVHHYTTQTVDCSSRGRLELNCSATDSDNSFDSCPTGLNGLYPAMKFAELLENEKSNFSLVNTAVAFLGGVPAMINPADMSNTIPNEKVVMSYLSFLCARLLDLRNETRAARVIQGVWRNYRLKKDLQCYKERNMAAVKIQAAVRHFLQRHRAKKQYAASTIIKSAWRGFVTRKKLQIEKEKELWIIRERAATIIQAQWRMFSALTYYQNLRYKTIVVQSQWRMKRAVFAYGRIYCATTVLQRYLKAFIIGRKEHTSYLSLKAAVLKIQRGYRRWKIQKTQRENHAARVLQTAFRKWYIEKIAKRAAAAIKIQSFYRMQRCLYQYRKIQRSALFIQAHYRGHAQRCQYQKHKQQLNAAIVIQSAFRGYCVRKKALRLKYATVLIQRWYRASARRNVERQLFLKMCCAARTIQVAYRRKRACNSLKQHRAATAIQAAFRKFVTRRRYLALRKATVVIQQKRRATILSRRTKEDYETLKKAVLIIQANWRGRADRMRLEKSHQCATLIKAHYLRYKAQVEFRSKKAAAVVIQRHYQAYVAGKKTRTAFLQKRAACVKIAAGYRGMKVRTDLKEKHKSAVVIQAAFRMYLMRKQYILIQSATIIIQSRYRALLLCRAHRHKYEELKKAALKIQTIYRGWRQREEFKKRDNAARVIQALFKMHRVHMAYVTMKCAAIILQERFRAKMLMDQQLKKYRTMKSAAIIIQAAYRGHRTRVKIAQMQRAAIVLQRKFLTMRERNKFLAIRSATLAFQQRYRAVILMREEREHYLSKCRLVIFLQAALRGYIIRKQLGIKHSAAVKIQSNFRRYLQTNYYRRLRWASGVLQARYKANKEIRREKQALTAKRHAVIVLQSAVRGMICRKMIKRKQKASSIIQRAFRAHFEHKKYITLKSSVLAVQRRFRATQAAKAAMQHYQNLHKSAVIIQAAYRGLRVRKDVACWHQAATLIQSTFRMHREEVKFQDLRLSTIIIQKYYRAHLLQKKDQRYYLKVRSSAITLQAAIRGLSVRRRIAKMHRAATIVQANFKRHKQQLVFRKQCLAARVIQQRFRALRQRNLEMKRYQEFRNAACYLQSAFRRMKKRHLIKQRYQAATVIQSAFRGHREKRKFQAMCSSTITIQRYYRRVRALRQRNLEKQRYQEVKTAVIRLQAAFRGMKTRRSIKRWQQAATVIQSAFRGHREKIKFQAMCSSAITIQTYYRAYNLQKNERYYFMKLRSSIICLQAAYRGHLERRRIAKMHKAATIVQAHFKRHRQQLTFKKQLWAVCILQQRVRGLRQRNLEKQRYQEVKTAVTRLQAAFRGMKTRRSIKRWQQAATVIQSVFRAHCKLKRYLKIKSSALTIQQRFRSARAAKSQRKRFLELCNAAIILQAHFRGKQTRKFIVRLHQAATVIQLAYRKHVILQILHASVVVIQKHYRAFIRQRQERTNFLKMKWAAVILQAAYRGHCVRRDINQQNGAACLIQSYWRCSVQRRIFQKKREAAVKLQERFRAMQVGNVERKRFVRIRQAAVTLQSYYRDWVVRKQEHEAAIAQRRLRFAGAVFHHLCAIKIQRALRAYWTLKTAKTQIHSVIIIQNLVRMVLQKRRYLADRRKVVTAQRAVRRWLARRHKSALVIQCATRKFLLLRRQKKVEKGIVKAQALWRGHVSRKLNDSTKVIKLRQKLRKVSAGAREEDKLRNKTSSALDCILRYKHFSSILEALKNLEATTRLSPVCCEHLVESGATSVIFTLIISCNRSVPCMDVITYSIQILLNLSKYHKTIEAVYAVENSVNILVDLLQTYRGKAGDKVGDKGKDIFTKACFLLVLLLQDKCRAEEVVKCPKILDKIKRIYSLTIHKHNMDTERNVTKQKMAASVNGSFYVPATPRKTRPVQKFAPDWVLRKDKLKNIVDPLEAIKMLASALFIVL